MRSVRLLWRLLLFRPLVLVLLILLYGAAALLLVKFGSHKGAVGAAPLAAFAVGGLSAVLTERIARFSRESGVIGLPDHARAMQRVQGGFLAVFAAVPVCSAILLGAPPLGATAAILVATSIGIVFATYRVAAIVLVVLSGQVLPRSQWMHEPVVQAIAIAASGVLLWRWFDLPTNAERGGGLTNARLADARHERRHRSVPAQDTMRQEPLAGAEGLAAQPVSAGAHADLGVPALLAVGLGYNITTNWRGQLYGFGIALAILAAWQLLHRQAPNPFAYTCVTAVCCMGIVGRLQHILRRWMGSAHEQALLRLAPQWPGPRLIKRAFIGSTLRVQRGTIAVWASASVAARALGCIDGQEVALGFFAMLATSLAFTPAAWAVLAQRRIRETNLPTILCVLMVGVGTVVAFSARHSLNVAFLIGVLLMAGPLVVALAWYALVPLRFPVNVDARVLQGKL